MADVDVLLEGLRIGACEGAVTLAVTAAVTVEEGEEGACWFFDALNPEEDDDNDNPDNVDDDDDDDVDGVDDAALETSVDSLDCNVATGLTRARFTGAIGINTLRLGAGSVA